jgi:hypothetical protein
MPPDVTAGVVGRPGAAYAAVVDDFERRARRMERVRYWIRAELMIAFMIAFATPIIAGFMFIAAPGFNPYEPYEPSLLERLIPWVGPAGMIIGLVGVVRFSRVDSEPGERTWRYRDY